jgi:hypothetical protein
MPRHCHFRIAQQRNFSPQICSAAAARLGLNRAARKERDRIAGADNSATQQRKAQWKPEAPVADNSAPPSLDATDLESSEPQAASVGSSR